MSPIVDSRFRAPWGDVLSLGSASGRLAAEAAVPVEALQRLAQRALAARHTVLAEEGRHVAAVRGCEELPGALHQPAREQRGHALLELPPAALHEAPAALALLHGRLVSPLVTLRQSVKRKLDTRTAGATTLIVG